MANIADTVTFDPKPIRIGVAWGLGVHRTEFGRKQFRVAASDPEDDQCAGVADHGGTDSV
jgi:hypothetical protein